MGTFLTLRNRIKNEAINMKQNPVSMADIVDIPTYDVIGIRPWHIYSSG
jgi:hypothetical protein